jgi:hypothetical protein
MEGEEEDFALTTRRNLWRQGHARTIQFIESLERGDGEGNPRVKATTSYRALTWIIQESNTELLERLLKANPEAAFTEELADDDENDNDDIPSTFGAFHYALGHKGCSLQIAERLIYSLIAGRSDTRRQCLLWMTEVCYADEWEPWFEEFRGLILRLLIKEYDKRPVEPDYNDYAYENFIFGPFAELFGMEGATRQNREMTEIISVYLSERNELVKYMNRVRFQPLYPMPSMAESFLGDRLREARERIFAVLNPSFMNLTGLSPELITRFLSFIEPYEQHTMIRILNEILEKKHKDRGALTNSTSSTAKVRE